MTDTPVRAEPAAASATAAPAEAELHCPDCGYNLSGIDHIDRCPECGLAIDRQGIGRSVTPWVHRRHLGRVRAYWRTLLMATLRPRFIATDVERLVRLRDAQRFRTVTAVLAALPIIAALVGWMFWYGSTGFLVVVGPRTYEYLGAGKYPPHRPGLDVVMPWEAGATLPPAIPLGLLLFFFLGTGVAGYWFHPRSIPVERQNRAIALSYYASAPLAWTVIPVAGLMASVFLRAIEYNNLTLETRLIYGTGQITFVAGTAAILSFMARSTWVLLRETTRSGRPRLVLAMALILVSWLVCAVPSLVVFPWLVGYFRLMITSLG